MEYSKITPFKYNIHVYIFLMLNFDINKNVSYNLIFECNY